MNINQIRTPERPKKKFRNDSSPFQGAALAKSELKAIWEWSAGGDEWIPYSPQKAEVLESAFCNQDCVILPGEGIHVVDLRRFVQRNTQTGKERGVRRQLIDVEPADAPHESSCDSKYDGRTLYLNAVSNVAERHPVDCVRFEEILGDVSDIKAILLTSYGTDIEWLLSHFLAGQTPIVLVDQPPSDGSGPSSMSPLGRIWPMFQLVHPTLRKDGAFGSGTMHCKLMLILRASSLRISISSANLLKFDWERLTQNVWLCDIPAGGTGTGKGVFGSDLKHFVSALLRDQRSKLSTDWNQILAEWEPRINEHVPEGVFLVQSVPGLHSGRDRNLYGHMRLREVLSSQKCMQQPVRFQMSSIGLLTTPFMTEFTESVNSGGLENFRILWPEYEVAMTLEGNDHMMVSERNAAGAARFMTELSPVRTGTANHSKVMQASGSWVYAGSHNLSMSAWGSLVFEGNALKVASFELGVVLVNSNSQSNSPQFKISLPFLPPNPNGSPPIRKPWMIDLFRRTVSSGIETLSAQDRAGLEPELLSLWEFLALKSRKDGKPVCVAFLGSCELSEHLKHTVLPGVRNACEIFCVLPPPSSPCSYASHLLAALGCRAVPALAVLAPGSVTARPIIQFDDPGELMNFNSATLGAILNPLSTLPFAEPALDVSGAASLANSMSLLCLDVDGTLVESNTSTVLLPMAIEFLKALDPSSTLKIALVTNQGAVGLRHWMETGRFGDPKTLPSQSEVETRIAHVRDKVGAIWKGPLTVFMAFRYQSKNGGRWGTVPASAKDDPRWNQDWRKPGPGMITAAKRWAGVSPFANTKVLMVGDMDADEGAAKAAGVRFRRAPNFFTDMG